MTRRRKRQQPPRVLRYLQPCPDCCATFDGNELVHESTCPLAAGVDDICDADRRWFIDHPGDWYYTRPITAAERQTMEHVDPAGAATNPNHVHVINQPWGRIRQFCNHNEYASMAIDPDDQAAS
jgi:hypothetical protein